MKKVIQTQEELIEFLDAGPYTASLTIGAFNAHVKSGVWTANVYMGGASSIPVYKVAEHVMDHARNGATDVAVLQSAYGIVEIEVNEKKPVKQPTNDLVALRKLLSDLPVDSIIMVEYKGMKKYKRTYRKQSALLERWVPTQVIEPGVLAISSWDTEELNNAKIVWVVYNPKDHGNMPCPDYVASDDPKELGDYKLSSMNPCKVVWRPSGAIVATFTHQEDAQQFVKEMNAK